VARYEREIALLGPATLLADGEETKFWRGVQNYTQRFTEKFTEGAVIRTSCTLTQLREVMSSFETPAIARAASGVCYAYFSRCDAAAKWIAAAKRQTWKSVIEFSPQSEKQRLELWPAPGSDFEMMKKVKDMFDPHHLLNNGRLYRLI
jgi:hypothetical protein